MKAIYRLDWNVGRGYQAHGMFVADKSEVSNIMGKEIYFGEICGKHSEVVLEMNDDVLKQITDDQVFIEKFIAVFGEGTISGHNPLDYDETDEY